MKRKVQVTIETRQLLIVKKMNGVSQLWCSECVGDVPLIRPEQAAVLAGVSPQMIDAWMDAGLVHFTESPEGWLPSVFGSLLDESRNKSTPLRP